MAYTTPRTWTEELVTASLLNEQLRDNMVALKDPPTDAHDINEGADYTTSANTWADIDSTDLSSTITTTGGDVLLWFVGTVNVTSGRGHFDFTVDGTRVGGDDGLVRTPGASVVAIVPLIYLVRDLAAGQHTFRVQWKSAGATLWAGAGTANADVHPHFGAREI